MAYKIDWTSEELDNLDADRNYFSAPSRSTDSQDMQADFEDVSFPLADAKDITGTAKVTQDGDILAFWATEWSNPWSDAALWHPLPYWDCPSESDNLPVYWSEENALYDDDALTPEEEEDMGEWDDEEDGEADDLAWDKPLDDDEEY